MAIIIAPGGVLGTRLHPATDFKLSPSINNAVKCNFKLPASVYVHTQFTVLPAKIQLPNIKVVQSGFSSGGGSGGKTTGYPFYI